MTDSIYADFGAVAAIETAPMDWQTNPGTSVWRKRLMLRGYPENGAITSVVRLDAGAHFTAHDHCAGEEILVLDGTFSDEHGD
jgi:anti-sigma factor ChrR (cupin superfamily)